MSLRNAWPGRGKQTPTVHPQPPHLTGAVRRALTYALFALVTMLGGCTPQAEKAVGVHLTLVHTNDTMGVIEPCG